MLQQTRVSVVIDYWERWMAKWPTMEQLALAEEDEVASAWRGLGYYSRARRIHEAARLVVQDPKWRGLLPQDAAELQAKIPGVGRYTAGAISSIVFGEATSMVDGNVLRVLSRQLGILGNVKSDKAVIDLLWAAADALVEAVVLDDCDVDETGSPRPNDRPGRWGQALMELGSTICTPNPDCAACPINITCRAHHEGKVLAAMQGDSREPASEAAGPIDIEDVCGICEPFEFVDEKIAEVVKPKTSTTRLKQATVSSFFSSQSSAVAGKNQHSSPELDPDQANKAAAWHVRRFPSKSVKKALPEQDTIVCAVRRRIDGRYLLWKRPEKGLLAGLWEFPSYILPDTNNTSGAKRKHIARGFVEGLFESTDKAPDTSGSQKHPTRTTKLKHIGELGSVPWTFSHLKLTMHVHVFQLEDEVDAVALGLARDAHRCRWADAEGVEQETMGTGSR
ncbi:hypothetical protein VPNG_10404 [Cytospora leucostoma]|uniref:Adenine DNA glycosylase n=1 Tax=Cytospora leucostoma TaxID=1230097 RepID=A0A423V8A9_9PEZI|nr:hypothetical protein VPNG_10404 [Cytospora leucostoma]